MIAKRWYTLFTHSATAVSGAPLCVMSSPMRWFGYPNAIARVQG